MKLACRKCGSRKYNVMNIGLLRKDGKVNDNYYFQKNKCLSCSTETIHRIPLKIRENKYRYIYLGSYNLQLHRFIMELKLSRNLLSSERIIFKNGNKGDCRMSNLIVKKVNKKRIITHA